MFTSDPRVRELVPSALATVCAVGFLAAAGVALSGLWSVVAFVLGALAVVGAVLAARWLAAHPARLHGRAPAPSTGRGPLVVLAVELVLLVAGLIVIGSVLSAGEYSIAWVAIVVGLHFLVLGLLWRSPAVFVLAAAQTVLGLLGFVMGAITLSSLESIAFLAGLGSGVVLLAMAALDLGHRTRTL